MPSRRTLLTGCGLTLAVGTAGCLDQFRTDGTHNIVTDTLQIDDRDEGPPVAARQRELAGEDERGDVTAAALVYEHEGRLLLLSELRVDGADGEWSHNEFGVTHDWTDADGEPAVRDHDTNLVPADDGETGEIGLERHSDPSLYEWSGEIADSTRDAWRYAFLSEVEAPDTGPDTRLATVQHRVEFTEGGLFGSDRGLGFTLRLTYGDVDPELGP